LKHFQGTSINAAKLRKTRFSNSSKSSEKRIGKLWPQHW